MAHSGNDKPIDLMKLSQQEAERLQRAMELADRKVSAQKRSHYPEAE